MTFRSPFVDQPALSQTYTTHTHRFEQLLMQGATGQAQDNEMSNRGRHRQPVWGGGVRVSAGGKEVKKPV